MTDNEHLHNVLSSMDTLIRRYLESAASQQRHPSADADASDDLIKDMKDRAKTLRRLREEFENCVTGVI